jgi:uncharacterized protein
MKILTFLLIFLVILLIYSLANFYLFSRGVQAFSIEPPIKRCFAIVYFLVTYSFFAGILLERAASSAFSEWVFRMGSLWLPFMLYFLFAVILIDLVRLANHVIPFLPEGIGNFKQSIGIAVVLVVTGIVVLGMINASSVQTRKLDLEIDKKVTGKPEIKVFMASDIHLGALIGAKSEKKLLELISREKPDLVLFCGDLIDSEIAPVLRKKLGSHLQEIEAPLGVYAITGNHEYIGGIRQSLAYLKSINIEVLVDSVLTLPNGITLVGRNDRSAMHGNGGQKPLNELLAAVDHAKPLIVMNHQPYNLDEASRAQVDLHLSGHTHHGQMWPFNYITRAMFEVSWGYKKKGNSHFYVSSGFGTWGPPVRLGNRPEVVLFTIQFKN